MRVFATSLACDAQLLAQCSRIFADCNREEVEREFAWSQSRRFAPRLRKMAAITSRGQRSAR
eukprot:3645195-Prymnesium_polylepis.1